MDRAYTDTQGQYLAFIYYYTKIHGVAPAEADMQRHFEVSPPSVHNIVSPWRSRGSVAGQNVTLGARVTGLAGRFARGNLPAICGRGVRPTGIKS